MFFLALLLSFRIPPTPTTAVNDYANVLSQSDKADLERRLSHTGVVIAIFPSLEGEDERDLSNQIARKWGVSRSGSGKDDGVLITLFLQEHRWNIEVGYENEPILTDLQAKQVGMETLRPKLREGDYAGALRDTSQRILDILDRKAVAPRVLRNPQPPLAPLFILIAIIVIGALFARRRGTLGSGGWSSLPWWLWWIGGGRGGGWGGGWGGGGDFGGGGGGGDSGNFGGGDFGGGGASGDW